MRREGAIDADATATLFLPSNASSHITADELMGDGGHTAQ
jgi:hypothetical protein